jgi:GT2 family glycosyltransferase
VAEAPLVSIVILAYKRLDRLRETLRHTFEDLAYPHERLEVIVVDNASANGTPEMVAAEFPGVRVVELPENVGVSGWNAGLAVARGDWLLMLDDDGHLTGDTLARAVARAEAERADLVSMRSRSGYDPDFFFDSDYPTGLLSFWGTAALLSRRAFAATGGYDPRVFVWAGELELTMRVLDAGLRHLTLPDLAAVHMKPPPEPGRPLQVPIYRMNQRNLAYVAARSLRWRDLVPVQVNRVVRVLLDSRTLDRGALTALPEVARGTLAGLRARRPVRPEVSALYRRNFPDFGSPFIFMRGPVARLRALRDPERAQRDRLARDARVYVRRARYFPAEPSVLSL